jgi:glucose-6-phosphate isomerase
MSASFGRDLPYHQDLSRCFGDRLTIAAYEAHLARTSRGLDKIRAAHKDGSLPLLQLPSRSDDLAALAPLADRLSMCNDLVVLGTGGSSLGGKTLAALTDASYLERLGRPRLHFMDNVDPASFAALVATIVPRRTVLLAISKSGSTAETLTQLLTLLPTFRAGLGSALGQALVAITEPTDNPLRRLVKRLGGLLIDHDPLVGGRYSVLSPVGLLPTMVAGLDAAAVRRGAAQVLAPVLAGAEPKDIPAACGAALAIAGAETGFGITVLMPYADRLEEFGMWYRQLWAESLGKQGKGTTPIRAMGTVDQHSQLQLYLDGPRDKLFTVLSAPSAGIGVPVSASFADDSRLDYLVGRSLGDLLDAETQATVETLARNHRPVREIQVQRIDETTMGALFMHFMLETILAADLIDVDPFDQPAVEQGKVLTREYMARSAQQPKG